jgi:hypothetical protein
MANIDNGSDPQDRAEVLDETNLTEDGGNIANFDDISDVYDATSASGDADIDDLDPERDEAEFETAEFDDLAEERDDAGLRAAPEDRSFASDADRVSGEQEQTRNYEASDGAGDDADKPGRPHDPGEDAPDEKDEQVDKQLDKGLKETFPASDPVPINPGAD